MHDKYSLEERCRKILEENGGFIADKARMILLKDPALRTLRSPLEFISKNWRDPLTPAMISLSCEAVGGQSEDTYEAALALSLMHLSFYIWDDIVDKAAIKSFKPTLFGKFGEGTALIIGGLASARAFSILDQADLEAEKHKTVTELIWNLWIKMAKAETAHLELLRTSSCSSKAKFRKIKTEAADLETCLRIGATIGSGSKTEVQQLGRYGLYLGVILGISKDFHVSMNLTVELADKIKSCTLPYSVLWAREHSERIRKKLNDMANTNTVEPSSIREIVEDILKTKALDNTEKAIREFADGGIDELLKLKKNSSTQTLRFFIDAQCEIFNESLSAFRQR